MMRTAMVLGVVSLVVLMVGCTPTSEQRDTEFALRKAEQDRDRLERLVSQEQARNTLLEDRLEAYEANQRAGLATISSLREQVSVLEEENLRLTSLIEERVNRPLKRPQVSSSPLPAEVDEALRGFAARHTGRVWYDAARGAVSFANDRLFTTGSDIIETDARQPLVELAGILGGAPADYEVVIVGHTDDVAIRNPNTQSKHPTNWHLSVHRAIAVQQVMIGAGLPSERVAVMGYGPYRPVSDDRAQNRRVEVFLVRAGMVRGFEPVRGG
jgi:chemotaxis protein MotB